MPLTSNEKLDRKSLPGVSLDGNLSEYEAPRNETEDILSKIWSEVIGFEKIGINDNFVDLGGHFLKIINLFWEVKRKFNLELYKS